MLRTLLRPGVGGSVAVYKRAGLAALQIKQIRCNSGGFGWQGSPGQGKGGGQQGMPKMPDMPDFKMPPLPSLGSGSIMGIFSIFLALVAGKVLWEMKFLTDAGVLYIHQNTLTGSISVYTEPGLYFKVPFFSTITVYKQVITKTYGGSTSDLEAPSVRFADTYTGQLPSSFRFKLPTDPKKAIKMHKEFRNQPNLESTLLDKNARDVLIITATQYTGEEFFQGGLNVFKSQLADQLRNGVYETERRQVEVEQLDLAPVSMEQTDGKKIHKSTQLVWKTVPILDNDGFPKRSESPLDQYGIEVTQVTISDPRPERQLETLLQEKKRLVAERIKAVQEQETAKAQARTEQLKKEIERTKEVQDAQRQKELAIIGENKQVEIARQIAMRGVVEERKKQEMAQIDKEKELQIAEANLAINKANALAAAEEAKAILHKGNAEATVIEKKYGALMKNKEVYMAELQRDVSKVLYEHMKDIQVQMPQNYIQGDGSGKMTSNLDVITGLTALRTMHESDKVGRSQAGAFL